MKIKNLFAKAEPKQVQVMERPKDKTTTEIIEEIHETFYSEVDRLLASAKVSNSLETDKAELIAKSNRLIQMGFVNTKEAHEASVEIQRLNKLKEENQRKADLIEAINYFTMRYPNYKFITVDSVHKICQKYGLVYGEISKYKGFVPEKNLQAIEKFVIDENDECHYTQTILRGIYGNHFGDKNYVTKNKKEELRQKEIDSRSTSFYVFHSSHEWIEYKKCPLEIAAPISDFDMTGSEIKDYKIVAKKIEIPDPVVFRPVIYKGEKYFLIVTAWGDEASDELVVNQRNN